MGKKIFALLIVMLMTLLSSQTAVLLFSQQEEWQIKEKVTVVNVEVPVRVFYRGAPVDNLTRRDFKLYEDGKMQGIHGFFKFKKKIKTQTLDLEATQQTHLVYPSRCFVLIFRISDCNDHLKKGLDYIFENILKEKDQLLVFANDKTLFLNNLADKRAAHVFVNQMLAEQALKARQLLHGYLIKIKQLLRQIRTEDAVEKSNRYYSAERKVIEFLEKYLVIWREYKHRFLVPDMDRYYQFAQYLERIQKEKWVISFYQLEMFPALKPLGEYRRDIEILINADMVGEGEQVTYGRVISKLLQTIDRELNAAIDFPAEEVSTLFYKAGATFHSILMRVEKEADSQDLEFKRISTDIENSLREITARTGGELIASNDLKSALDTVVEKEDITYMLTYYPENPDRVGKIKVEVSNKKYNVLYDRNIRADYIREYLAKKEAQNPTIQLKNVTFDDKRLTLVISDFQVTKDQAGEVGLLNLRICIKDSSNKAIFDEEKGIQAKSKSISVSLGFDWLEPGRYSFLIDVKDRLTDKSTSHFFQPVIE